MQSQEQFDRGSQERVFSSGISKQDPHAKYSAKSSQGYRAMDVVDLDRAANMRSKGFEGKLVKLTPEECNPMKNWAVGAMKEFVRAI